MKPKNFPGKKLARQIKSLERFQLIKDSFTNVGLNIPYWLTYQIETLENKINSFTGSRTKKNRSARGLRRNKNE